MQECCVVCRNSLQLEQSVTTISISSNKQLMAALVV